MLLHVGDVVADADGGQVDVSGGAACGERGHQHPALEHEVLGMLRTGQAGQEPFQRVQGEELGRIPALPASKVAQVVVRAPRGGIPGWTRTHNSTSRACRSRGSAFGNDAATSIRLEAELPRRRNQRRSASWATSAPSWCISRKQSTTVRSAE